MESENESNLLSARISPHSHTCRLVDLAPWGNWQERASVACHAGAAREHKKQTRTLAAGIAFHAAACATRIDECLRQYATFEWPNLMRSLHPKLYISLSGWTPNVYTATQVKLLLLRTDKPGDHLFELGPRIYANVCYHTNPLTTQTKALETTIWLSFSALHHACNYQRCNYVR